MKALIKNINLFRLSLQYQLWGAEKASSYVDEHVDKWIFIIGCNNSGTTLLRKLFIKNAPVAVVKGEGQFRTNALLSDLDAGCPRLFSEHPEWFRFDPQESHKAERIKFDWYHAARGGSRKMILEKSPPNMLRTLWMQEHFSPSHFIVLIRNPLAVCEGMKRKLGIDIERAAHHWNNAHTFLLEDLSSLRSNTLLSYHELASNPLPKMQRLFKDLDFDPDNIEIGDFSVHERQGQVKNYDQESVDRLSSEEIDTINGICEDNYQQLLVLIATQEEA